MPATCVLTRLTRKARFFFFEYLPPATEAPAAEAPAAEAPAHAAVLFVPGNAGAHTQAKSLAAEAAKAGLPLDFYAVGLGAELVAFRGQLLARQARFVHT